MEGESWCLEMRGLMERRMRMIERVERLGSGGSGRTSRGSRRNGVRCGSGEARFATFRQLGGRS